jgi:hypothetical protein
VRALAVLLLLAPGCRNPFGEPPERAEIERLVAETRTKMDELERHRKTELPKALATLVPRPDLGRCPIEVADPIGGPAQNEAVPGLAPEHVQFLRDNAIDRMKQRFAVRAPEEVAGAPSPFIDATRSELDLIANVIDPRAGFTASLDWPAELEKARRLAAKESWDYDIVVVAEEREPPKLLAPKPGDRSFSFVEGKLRGRAYLYSYAEGKVLCAASVEATSSDDVRASIPLLDPSRPADATMATKLAEDLEANAMSAAARGMVLAGPKL